MGRSGTMNIRLRRGGRVWRWPVVLAALSTLGLASALLADGIFDVVSWCALGAVAALALKVLLVR